MDEKTRLQFECMVDAIKASFEAWEEGLLSSDQEFVAQGVEALLDFINSAGR